MKLKDGTEVRKGFYVQSVRSLYKVSELRDGIARMQICLDNGKPLDRTTIRTFTAGQLAAMTVPSKAIVEKYHRLLASA